MSTDYPFTLPEGLEKKLPAPSGDGLYYIDVRVGGKWDGILVVDKNFQCIGIHCDRQNMEFPLPFAPAEIEDIRPASLWNRTLAFIPSWLIFAYPYACPFILPVLIVFDNDRAPIGSLLIIFFGVLGQTIVLKNLKAYCLTNIFLILAILGIQTAVFVHMLRSFIR